MLSGSTKGPELEKSSGLDTRKRAFYKHFEKIAPGLHRYRKRYSYFWDDIVRYCNYFIHEDDRVLEVGCATGDTLSRLRGKEKTGIDFSPSMIRIARERYPGIRFEVQDAEHIDLERHYDVVILSHVTGYFDDVLQVFLSLRRVCHPRTRLIINYYNFLWEPLLLFGEKIGIKKKSPRQNWLSGHQLETFLYLAGFESYRVARRLLLPAGIPVLSFLFNRILGRLPLIDHLCINQYVFARPAPEQTDNAGSDYSVSVVIPARNEAGNVAQALRRMPRFGKSLEIIFVEGHSTDDTWERIIALPQQFPEFNIRVCRQDGGGKGDAVRKGFSLACGDVLMILDADLTVAPEDLPLFYYAIAGGKGEFINGTRLVYPMEKNAMRLLNFLANKFFSILFSWLLEQPVTDTLCGTKVLFRSDYERLIANRSFFGDFDPFGDFDLLFGAYKLNLKIIDLPVAYRERSYGSTNISRFTHGLLLLRMAAYAARKIKFV